MTPFIGIRLLVAAVTLVVVAGNAASAFASSAAAKVRFGDLAFEAKSVAFVGDGSRWMKNKFVELKEELGRAVEGMAVDQQFAVVFFADGEATAFAGGALTPATDENKNALKAWLKDVRLGDTSTPAPGLSKAFEAKPEAVVLVSDGKFKDYDGVESHVAALNPKRERRVYAVGFFADDGEDDSREFVKFMRRLAERNGGVFKAVYADELKRFRSTRMRP